MIPAAFDKDLYLRAKPIFLHVREQSPAARSVCLDQECAGDERLRAEVLAWLEADAGEEFLAPPPALCAWPPDLGADRGYHVLAELGRGGSSVVFLAERVEGAFRRRVALKLLARAGSTEALRRWERERRILAQLDHPNIARLLDVGATAAGQPYLVMEYVEGRTLREHCTPELGLRARLELFLQVCDAVAYAHGKLVLHRDLKPQNVVVGHDGAPKLLDFGIARLLEGDDGLGATAEGFQPLTLRYASPEQLAGEPVSIASDVYSLGVMLYELLAHESPYGEAAQTLAGLTQAIREARPGAPSAVLGRGARRAVPGVRGDLDAICLRALEKVPAERYASVERLTDDLRRHLDGRPVEARRGERLYRVTRTLRRRWPVVLTVGAFAGLLVAFLLVQRAQLQRTAAERDRAERLAGLLVDVFGAPDPLRSGTLHPELKALLDRGAAQVLAERQLDPLTRAGLMHAVGRVQLNLGDFASARPQLEGALALRRTHAPDSGELAALLNDLAVLQQQLGHLPEAEALVREALAIRRALGQREGPELADLLNSLAILRDKQGAGDEAEALFREVLELRRRRLPAEEREYARDLKNWSVALANRGRLAEADRTLAEAVAILQRLYPEGNLDLVRALGGLARLRRLQRRYDEAAALYRQSRAMGLRALGPQHREIAILLNNEAALLALTGQLAQAESALREALAIDENHLPEGHLALATERFNLGRLLGDLGRHADAVPLLTRALRERRAARPAGHPDVVRVEAALGRSLCGAQPRLGIEMLQRAVSDLDASPGSERWHAAQAQAWAAECFASAGRAREARELLDQALPVLERELGGETYPARTARALRRELAAEI